MGKIADELSALNAMLHEGQRLAAVSKYHPAEAIMEAYDAGQRIFAESHVQELVKKAPVLPADIQWHFIGHLQTNKVRQIVPFISLIHSVDSLHLLEEINRQAEKAERTVPCLIEVHIAKEETKTGFSAKETEELLENLDAARFCHVQIAGIMCMASNTDDMGQVREEFRTVAFLFKKLRERFQDKFPDFKELSMGMSGDFEVALEEGSTIIRVGTRIFGPRAY